MSEPPAALANFHEIAEGAEDAFERWHTAEHLPERLALPGFRRGRRYAAVQGSRPAYFVLYDTDSIEALRSPEYLARLDSPTPRTQAVAATMTWTARTAAACRFRAGPDASGGVVGAWRLSAAGPGRAGLFAWLYERGVPTALTVEGVVVASVYEGDRDATGPGSNEQKLRRGVDHFDDLLVVVEGHSLAAVAVACTRMAPLQAHGADAGDALGFFDLQVSQDAPA